MGTRGRLPMSQGLRVIRGDARPSRARPQIEATVPDTVPEPPAWLSEPVCAEWRSVSHELHRLGLLTELDLQLFAAWCVSVARWKAALAALAQVNDDERLTHPLSKVCRDSAREMQRLGAPLGLAGPSSRARLSVSVKRPASKLAGFLGGLGGDESA